MYIESKVHCSQSSNKTQVHSTAYKLMMHRSLLSHHYSRLCLLVMHTRNIFCVCSSVRNCLNYIMNTQIHLLYIYIGFCKVWMRPPRIFHRYMFTMEAKLNWHPSRVKKTTVIRRIAVRETDVSRHHWVPIVGLPETPWAITGLSY